MIDRNLSAVLISIDICPMNSKPSVSKLSITIEVYGKGRAEGEVFRHLAPITLNSLLKNMPLHGRAFRFKDEFIYITSGIIAGVEKARKSFQRGQIGFLSSNGALCVFLKNCDVAVPINPLGKISSGLDVLMKAEVEDVIAVKIEQSSKNSISL